MANRIVKALEGTVTATGSWRDRKCFVMNAVSGGEQFSEKK
jgi:hypothetical protein